ncbi:hypothetical protein SUGI_0280340 [Cryptomeria japonica]|nr:hypothetical protein SUGI_0280340 [Cryptomeria japonica]
MKKILQEPNDKCALKQGYTLSPDLLQKNKRLLQSVHSSFCHNHMKIGPCFLLPFLKCLATLVLQLLIISMNDINQSCKYVKCNLQIACSFPLVPCLLFISTHEGVSEMFQSNHKFPQLFHFLFLFIMQVIPLLLKGITSTQAANTWNSAFKLPTHSLKLLFFHINMHAPLSSIVRHMYRPNHKFVGLFHLSFFIMQVTKNVAFTTKEDPKLL